MLRPWGHVALVVLLASSAHAATVQDSGFAVELMHDGNGMVSVVFGPERRMYVAEKSGRILLFKIDSADPGDYLSPEVFADLQASVDDGNEQGLLGLALHPNFAVNRYLYAFYSYPGGQRLVRIEADASYDLISGSPTVLLDGLPNNHNNHNAGDVRFHPTDGHIYIALGDDAESVRAQDLDVYNGKLLRVDENGLGLPDNPFYDGDTDSVRSRVWGLGCRNPFRFTFHPTTHVLYVSENGGGTDRLSRWGAAGANGGWPDEFTNPSDPDVTNIVTQSPSITGVAIVSGGPFADPSFPESDAIYLANWKEDSIRRWRLTGSQLDSAVPIEIDGSNAFVTGLNEPSHLTFGPDGDLYVATTGRGVATGELRRIRFVAGTPPTASISTAPSPAEGAVPLSVSFTDTSTDDGTIESRLWDFGDGSSSTAANPSHSFDAAGVYTVSLTVTDDQGLADTATVTVTAYHPTSVTLAGMILDGRDFAGNGLPVSTELRLYQIDGVTPLPFSGGGGADGNAFAVGPGGAFEATLEVDLTGCGLVVSAGEPGADGFQPAFKGFVVLCGTSAFDASGTFFYLSDTAVSGRIMDTSGDSAVVDLGVSRGTQGSLFAVPGGRDFHPPIPPSGVDHRVDSDGLGYYHIPIPSGGGDADFHMDVVADTNADRYISTTFSVFVGAGTLVEQDVTLGLQEGGSDCDSLPAGDGSATFAAVQDVFDSHCIGCHAGVDPNAGLDLSAGASYDAIVGEPSQEVPDLHLVEPGDASLSFLFEKINCAAPQVGARMPTGYALSLAEQSVLHEWIEGGALPPGSSPPPAPGPGLVTGVVTGVGDAWQQVSLPYSYESMVVVATPEYEWTDAPAVTRVRNAAGSSFDLRVQNPSGAALDGYTVRYIVVEAGVYDVATHGVTMEAVRFLSTVTDHEGSWVGEWRSYSNAYSAPVVLGQVMSVNDPEWSVFWARGSDRSSEPSNDALYVGKQVSEDADTTRADEEVGYVVIESGSGTLNGTSYEVFVGADTVEGASATVHSYPLTSEFSGAVLSRAGIDGTDGGWGTLRSPDPLASGEVDLFIDEDQIGDAERDHTTESVAVLAFGAGTSNSPPAVSAVSDQTNVEGDTVSLAVEASDPDGDPLIFSATGLPPELSIDAASGTISGSLAVGSEGTYAVTVTVSDGDLADSTGFSWTVTSSGDGTTAPGPELVTGVVTGVGDAWQQVSLPYSYESMVVVATPEYEWTDAPAVTRVRNAAGSSFDLRVQNPSGAALDGYTVRYIVVEAGVYDVATHGVTMEAVRFLSTVTDHEGSWVGEWRSYSNTYSAPVVLGQVMSVNDPEWSVFWARGSGRRKEPSNDALYVGKQVSEDADTTRADEEVGYVVIESGSGTLNGTSYEVFVGADTVEGASATVHSYLLTSEFSGAVLSRAGIDGTDGGWGTLRSPDPLASGEVDLFIDEDQIGDAERDHTTESVAVLAFEPSDGGDETLALAAAPERAPSRDERPEEVLRRSTGVPGTARSLRSRSIVARRAVEAVARLDADTGRLESEDSHGFGAESELPQRIWIEWGDPESMDDEEAVLVDGPKWLSRARADGGAWLSDGGWHGRERDGDALVFELDGKKPESLTVHVGAQASGLALAVQDAEGNLLSRARFNRVNAWLDPEGLVAVELSSADLDFAAALRLEPIGEARVSGTLVSAVDGRFLRGDVNADGRVSVADAVRLVRALSRDGDLAACADAADVTDDGGIDASDALSLLRSVVLGEPERLLQMECAFDSTLDELDCEEADSCR